MSILNLIPGMSTLKIVGVGLLAGAVAFGAGYLKGRADMRAIARAEAVQATLDQLKERNSTDAEINDLDAAGLCNALGGRWVPEHGCR